MKYITEKDYNRCLELAEDAVENIPESRCRIKKETFYRALINALKESPERKPGKVETIVAIRGENLGTKRYPYMIKVTEDFSGSDITGETEASILCCTKWGRKYHVVKSGILVLVKK